MAPMMRPMTVPMNSGSPKMPNFFCMDSTSMSMSRTPGIWSMTQLRTHATGA